MSMALVAALAGSVCLLRAGLAAPLAQRRTRPATPGVTPILPPEVAIGSTVLSVSEQRDPPEKPTEVGSSGSRDARSIPAEWIEQVSAVLDDVFLIEDSRERFDCYKAHLDRYRWEHLNSYTTFFVYADLQYLRRETSHENQANLLERLGQRRIGGQSPLALDLLKSGVTTLAGQKAGLYLYLIDDPSFDRDVLQPTMHAAIHGQTGEERGAAICALGAFDPRYPHQVRETLGAVIQNESTPEVIALALETLAQALAGGDQRDRPAGLQFMEQAATGGRTLQLRLLALDMCWNLRLYTDEAQTQALRRLSEEAPDAQARARANHMLDSIKRNGDSIVFRRE